ncbi:MAG: Ig-like domain repeat protein, partial [Pseudonocardiaceae bacterium]
MSRSDLDPRVGRPSRSSIEFRANHHDANRTYDLAVISRGVGLTGVPSQVTLAAGDARELTAILRAGAPTDAAFFEVNATTANDRTDADSAITEVFVVNETVVDQPLVQAQTATSLSSSLNPSGLGQPVTFTATVSSSPNPPSGGTIQFKDGSVDLGQPVLLTGGSAAVTTSALAAGAHSITAVYGGGGAFAPSTSAALSQSVTTVATTTTTICRTQNKICTTTTLGGVTTTTIGSGQNVCGSPTIVGTAGNDVITGTAGPDVIDGLGGNDQIRGLGANDRICGNSG